MSEPDHGTLYLCATPIGNLEDITLRALRVLREGDLIAAEDTRHTRKLLQHYGIQAVTTSFHAHNQDRKAAEILDAVQAGKNVVLVSDAGLPGVSDPGALLAARAVEKGLPLVVIPGPSAPLTALVASGLRTERFAFEGFLPRKGRKKVLGELAGERRTLLIFESPNRVVKTLEELRDAFGERRVAVARELTKVHEEVFRGTFSEAIEHFAAGTPRGEFTLVVEGAASDVRQPGDVSDETLAGAVAALEREGLTGRDAVGEVARRFGLAKRDVYNRVKKK